MVFWEPHLLGLTGRSPTLLTCCKSALSLEEDCPTELITVRDNLESPACMVKRLEKSLIQKRFPMRDPVQAVDKTTSLCLPLAALLPIKFNGIPSQCEGTGASTVVCQYGSRACDSRAPSVACVFSPPVPANDLTWAHPVIFPFLSLTHRLPVMP